MKRSGFGSLSGACQVLQRRWFWSAMALVVASALWTPAWSWADSDDIVYVESNQTAPAGNSILAFRNDGSGKLTFIGSTPAGGVGVFDNFQIGPADADQQLQISPDRTLLFAVNSGSNTIAVFHINSDGSLTPVEGSPFPSGGSEPVSVGVISRSGERGHEDRDGDDDDDSSVLVVVNKDQDPRQNPFPAQPNYTSFRIGRDGHLTPVPQSTVSVAYFSSPTQALISPHGNLVFGADFQGGLLQSLSVDERGRLHQNPTTALPNSAFVGGPPIPHFPLGLWAHPSEPILYVGFVVANKLGVFRFNERGKLSFVRTAPNSGKAICWIRVNRAGTRIYTSDTDTNSISVYDSTDPENPIEIQHLRLIDNTGVAFELALDRSEEFLYTVSSPQSATAIAAANGIHVLKVASDGTLSEVGPPTVLPITGKAQAHGIEVF